jgi:hypothetical protein
MHVQTETRQLNPDQLLLDPNNYRFHDLYGYRPVNPTRYAEQGVQDRALQFLRDTPTFDLRALRDSIISNGFVPFEQIVVEAYPGNATPPKYVVIEGNRRAAALKVILSDVKGGALDLKSEVLSSITEISVIEIIGTEAERSKYQKTLMAIRHVAGIKEWGPYQQARLVVEMYENEEGAFGPVAQRIGISSREVGRRYRASKHLNKWNKMRSLVSTPNPAYIHSFTRPPLSQRCANGLAFPMRHIERSIPTLAGYFTSY